MQAIDTSKYLALYAAAYAPNSGLNAAQKEGIIALLGFLQADGKITDLRHAAYMLATVKHECAGTWQPIEENGKGAGKAYGKVDNVTGKAYYGRGYVQLTWKDNYREIGAALGLDLVNRPELALQSDTAYRIMSYGMRNGAFTGVGLNRYIHGGVCDYLNARKIINGTDCAEKIAAYASTIEEILKEATNGSV